MRPGEYIELNQMWFSVVSVLIHNNRHHHSGQNLLWNHLAVPHESTTFRPLGWYTAVDKSTDNAKPHSICFLPQCQSEKVFLRAEKVIAWHTDESSIVWTLIYYSKLANSITRLEVIVAKTSLFVDWKKCEETWSFWSYSLPLA